MKRLARNTLLALLLAAPFPILAHGDTTHGHGTGTEASQMPEGMDGMMDRGTANGMMNGHTMDGGMMPMMNMMMECASMMEDMHPNGTTHEGIGHHMDSGSMMNRRASPTEGASYDVATAEALARAYLHGQNPERIQELEILGATLEAGRYTVTYQLRDTEGAVLVDATTGAILSNDAQ